jgi:hypothetical protein
MFMLYALVLGLCAGWLLGGHIGNLGSLRIRWAPLAVVGLLLQLALFSTPLGDRIGGLGPPLYVASSVLVLAVVLRNLRIPAMPLVAGGAALNLLAITTNGGFMPASPGALSAVGKVVHAGYSNSALMAEPRLAPLTDIFAMPRAIPFANIFSVGDVLIGMGVAIVVALAMRGGALRNLPPRSHALGTQER